MAERPTDARSPGRVVLHVEPGLSSPLAMQAAVRMAQALRSEIELLFVENQELLDLAELPFAREITRTGRSRAIDSAAIRRDIEALAQSVFRDVERLAQAAEVALHRRIVRARPLEALAQFCQECGREHFIALGEPFGDHSLAKLRRLFEVSDAARGLVVVGPRGHRMSGPVAVVVEDEASIETLLATASRLMRTIGTSIVAVVLGGQSETHARLEKAVRRQAALRPDMRVVAAPGATGAQAIEMLRRLEAGLVISRFGGIATGSDDAFSALAAALECPLLLVR